MKGETIYVSGQITGLLRHEYKPKFDIAANYLQLCFGYDVINPCNLDRHRQSIIDDTTLNQGEKWLIFILDDLKHLSKCNAIYMLDNWESSEGAKIELAVAKKLGLEVLYEANQVNIR